MNLEKFERIYFAGIGGIGMSAMALFFLDNGKKIAGYDKTPSDITQNLEKLNVPVSYEDEISTIPEAFRQNPENTLVVYTPAIPSDSIILNYFKDHDFKVAKRAEVLGWITKDRFTIAVAGTHGKTTTSWMIAHCLRTAGIDCAALLGGISVNYKSNYLKPEREDCRIMIVEADEYDRSFLQLNPDIAVVTSAEPDHLDIYGDENELLNNFIQFTHKIKQNGTLVKSNMVSLPKPEGISAMITYGNDNKCDISIEKSRISDACFTFDCRIKERVLTNICMGVPGYHNIFNFMAAMGVLSSLTEIEEKTIKKAAESFCGVKRRFEFILKSKEIVFIDDYAHHPTELTAAIETARALYPDKKITGIFQPHLYSRTRDLATGFAQSLAWLDEVILLDIYPARESPIEGVSSYMLLEMIDNPNKMLVSKEYLPELLADFSSGVLLTLGAGDIDRLVEPIKNILQNNG